MNNNIGYDKIAEIYESKEKYINEMDRSTVDYQRLAIETIEWKIPNLMVTIPPDFNPSTVAEVGCFTGHLIANISINGKQNFQRYGYDVNRDAIEIARSTYSNVSFYDSDVFNSGKKFDLLILSDIIEHIEDDLGFIKKCHDLSSNLLVNIPLEKSLSQIGRKYGFDDPSGHLRAYSPNSARKLIIDSGYKIINEQIVCFYDSLLAQKRRKIDNPNSSGTRDIKSLARKLTTRKFFTNALYGCNLFAFLSSSEI